MKDCERTKAEEAGEQGKEYRGSNKGEGHTETQAFETVGYGGAEHEEAKAGEARVKLRGLPKDGKSNSRRLKRSPRRDGSTLSTLSVRTLVRPAKI